MSATKKPASRQDIAVVATGAIFPGRGDTTGFWRDIVDGVDTFGNVPPTHWLPEDYYDENPLAPDKTYGKRGAFISPQAFDPIAFGMPPNALSSTDTSQLLALIVAQQVLDAAMRESGGKLDTARTSVILGIASATELTAHMGGRLHRPAWIKGMREAGLAEDVVQDIATRIESNFTEWQESTFPGLLGNVVAGRIANRLDLGGSNYVTDAACASSLSALQIALHELRSGDSDTVLTGGVDTLNDILMFMCFSKTPALSPTGDCRPFSANADGTMLGEGIGMLALRRLEDAERDGNRIHAIIRGLGGASDGRATAIYAPLPSGQARALGRAYEQAGYGPETVGLVEAHGTGTVAGDKAELDGLHTVFGRPDGARDPWCAIGSVKSQIGHTKAAAGAASLVKIVGALSRKVLPPTLKVETPAPALSENTPFYINNAARPWISGNKTPRRASVSSFGFGGSNFHAALEEYKGPNAACPPRVMPAELLLFSESSPEALLAAVHKTGNVLEHEDDLSRLANETHGAFKPKAKCRAAVIADTGDTFRLKANKLEQYIAAGAGVNMPLGQGLHYASGKPVAGKTAFLFAGQGSQYVGMGAGLAMGFPTARKVWDEAVNETKTGEAQLHDLAFPPAPFTDADAAAQSRHLTRMENAQPAIAAVSLAQMALLNELGIAPDMCAGHSFGEVMALHAAGVFDASTALRIARERGAIMVEAAASSEGAMLAVQASAEAVMPVLEQVGSSLVIANDNAPDQVVLSGPVSAIDQAEQACRGLGLHMHRLNVATGFHSTCVMQAIAPFTECLDAHRFSAPHISVFANSTATPYPKTPRSARTKLARQIGSPVLFRQSLEAMYDAGARLFIEIGPGSVVSTFAKNTLSQDDVRVVSLDHKRENDVASFLSGIGQLAVLGHKLDLGALYADLPPCQERLPRPKFSVDISGANYQKPYPPEGGQAALPAPNPVSNSTLSDPAIRTAPMTEHTDPQPVLQATSEAERIYKEASQCHSEFLQMITTAHTAFLNVLSGAASSPAAGEPHATIAPPQRPGPSPAPPPQPVAAAPAPAEAPAPAPIYTPPPAPPIAQPEPVASAPSVNGAATPAGISADTIRTLIAEKTGYPPEMLEDDMDLEGELGIDSIKQVEILSALREQVPGLPEIEAEQLAGMRTIRNIADFFL